MWILMILLTKVVLWASSPLNQYFLSFMFSTGINNWLVHKNLLREHLSLMNFLVMFHEICLICPLGDFWVFLAFNLSIKASAIFISKLEELLDSKHPEIHFRITTSYKIWQTGPGIVSSITYCFLKKSLLILIEC